MFNQHTFGELPRVPLTTYEGKHRTPEIPQGVYGVSLGSHKRGMWLGSYTVEELDNDPNVRTK